MDTLSTVPPIDLRAETKPVDTEIESRLRSKLSKLQKLKFADDVPWYFFGSEDEKTIDDRLKINFGFKIHVPVPWDHSDFLKVIDRVIYACDFDNDDGHPTSFKIVRPTQRNYLGVRVPPNKGIVIYPKLLKIETESDRINWAETFRIGSLLRDTLKDVKGYSKFNVYSDIKFPSGIFVRYGALHKIRDGDDEHDASFWDNLARLRIPIEQKNQVVNLLGSIKISCPEDWEDNQIRL